MGNTNTTILFFFAIYCHCSSLVFLHPFWTVFSLSFFLTKKSPTLANLFPFFPPLSTVSTLKNHSAPTPPPLSGACGPALRRVLRLLRRLEELLTHLAEGAEGGVGWSVGGGGFSFWVGRNRHKTKQNGKQMKTARKVCSMMHFNSCVSN